MIWVVTGKIQKGWCYNEKENRFSPVFAGFACLLPEMVRSHPSLFGEARGHLSPVREQRELILAPLGPREASSAPRPLSEGELYHLNLRYRFKDFCHLSHLGKRVELTVLPLYIGEFPALTL